MTCMAWHTLHLFYEWWSHIKFGSLLDGNLLLITGRMPRLKHLTTMIKTGYCWNIIFFFINVFGLYQCKVICRKILIAPKVIFSFALWFSGKQEIFMVWANIMLKTSVSCWWLWKSIFKINFCNAAVYS